MRALQNLRNVGNKIAVDKQYKDQLWDDGMNYVKPKQAQEKQQSSTMNLQDKLKTK